MAQKYQNIHTNEILAISHIEIVKSSPKPFTVYVLNDGQRREESLFKKHWIILESQNE